MLLARLTAPVQRLALIVGIVRSRVDRRPRSTRRICLIHTWIQTTISISRSRAVSNLDVRSIILDRHPLCGRVEARRPSRSSMRLRTRLASSDRALAPPSACSMTVGRILMKLGSPFAPRWPRCVPQAESLGCRYRILQRRRYGVQHQSESFPEDRVRPVICAGDASAQGFVENNVHSICERLSALCALDCRFGRGPVSTVACEKRAPFLLRSSREGQALSR